MKTILERGVIKIIVPLIIVGLMVLIFAVPAIFKINSTKPSVPKTALASISPTSAESVSPTPSPIITISPSPTQSPSPVPTLIPSSVPTITPTFRPATPQPVSGPPGVGYGRINVATEKGNFTASVLTVDLNSARMITDTGNDGDCSTNCTVLSLQDYVNRNAGFAGVNATYFCPATYADCASKTNSYDFPVWNTRLGKWINGGNLFWNSRAMFYTDGSGAHYKQNANSFGGSLTAGIVNFPGLVDNGQVQIDEAQSGLSANQKAVGTKVGIGLIDQKKVVVVVASNVNMHQFAYVFKALGAKGALNLDTGGSTALTYNGKYLFGPGRALPNAIIFAR
jgi:hypothetical protein